MDERDYPEAYLTEEYQCDCTQLRAENEKLKADAKYGWQAQELILKNQALAAALVAKDEALDKYRGQIDRFGNHTSADALGIQPHAALVAKIKAEAVTEFLEREEKWTINEAILAKIKADAVREFGKAISHYANAHADRIERGEV